MSVSLCYLTSKADSSPFIACPPSGFQSDEAFTVNEWPEEYPTACRPQAWATATRVLLRRTFFSLEPVGG